jgi:GABA permease
VWYLNRRPEKQEAAVGAPPHRVLVMANETANSTELFDELRRIGADKDATYCVVVPASPIETGVAATHGPLDVWEATQQAAQARLEQTLETLRSENLDADEHWAISGLCAPWPRRSTRSIPTRS